MPNSDNNSYSKKRYQLVLLVLLTLTIALRLPFAWIPYQTGDIGTFLLHGMCIAIDGAVYGTDFYNGRGPGGFYLYALLLRLFGYEGMLWINLVGALWHATLTLLVILIAKKLWDRRVALYAGFFYSIFSFAHMLNDSLSLNVEPMALLPLLMSVYFFLSCYKKNDDGCLGPISGKMIIVWLLLSGLFLGLTFSIRQSMAAVLPVFCVLQFLQAKTNSYTTSVFLRGLSRTIFLLFGFIFGCIIGYIHPIVTGTLFPAIYCSIIFGFQHPLVTWLTRFINFSTRYLVFMLYQPLLWVGVLLVFIKNIRVMYALKLRSLLNPLFLIFAFFLVEAFGVFVMGRVTGHCFFALFAFAVLILANEFAERWFPNLEQLWLKRLVLLVGCVVPLIHFLLFPAGIIMRGYTIRDYMNEMTDENTLPFRAAQYIRNNSSWDDRIYCLTGTHANDRVYFMSKRRPAAVPFEGDFGMKVGECLEDVSQEALIVVFSSTLYGIEKVEDQNIRSLLLDLGYELIKHFEGKEYTRFYYCKNLNPQTEWIEIWKLKKTKTRQN